MGITIIMTMVAHEMEVERITSSMVVGDNNSSINSSSNSIINSINSSSINSSSNQINSNININKDRFLMGMRPKHLTTPHITDREMGTEEVLASGGFKQLVGKSNKEFRKVLKYS